MICKYCETENVDDAVFCKACGKRIDGSVPCPKCGNLNVGDSTFCIKCGARLDGKTQCPSCGTVHDGAFCPHCGKPSQAETAKKAEKPCKGEAASGWKKPVNLVGSVLLFLGALCAFAFVFCIGFSVAEQSVSMWEYFGSAYSDVAEQLDGLTEYSSFYEINMYLPNIICTVLFAATLIAVAVLAILAAVRFVQNLLGKSERTADKYSVATFFAYLAGVTALLFMHYIMLSASGAGVKELQKTTMNGATLAGVILGAVFLGLGVGCRIAVYGKELKNSSVLLKLICAAVGLTCIAIAWTFAAQAAGIVGKSGVVSSSKIAVKCGFSFALIITLLAQQNLNVEKLDEEVVNAYALSLTALILGIALIVLFALIAIRRARNFSEKGGSVLGLSIAAFVVALAYLIVSIFALDAFVATGISALDYVGVSGTTETTISYAAAIVCLVFAALNLATSVAQLAVGSALEKSVSAEEAETL